MSIKSNRNAGRSIPRPTRTPLIGDARRAIAGRFAGETRVHPAGRTRTPGR